MLHCMPQAAPSQARRQACQRARAGLHALQRTPQAVPSQPLRQACQRARAGLQVLQRVPQAAHSSQRCLAVPLLPGSSCRRPARRPQCLLACRPLRCPNQGGSVPAGDQQAPRLLSTLRRLAQQGAPVPSGSERRWLRSRQRLQLANIQTELPCSVCRWVRS